MEMCITIEGDETFRRDYYLPGMVIGNGDYNGRVTIVYDDEMCLASVANKLGKRRLEICNRIVEDVLAGRKRIVEFVGDLKDTREIATAMINTVYSRWKGWVPHMSLAEPRAFFEPLIEHKARESEWMANAERVCARDLSVLLTKEWYVTKLDPGEESYYTAKMQGGHERFMGLIAERAHSALSGFQTVSFRRKRLFGLRLPRCFGWSSKVVASRV